MAMMILNYLSSIWTVTWAAGAVQVPKSKFNWGDTKHLIAFGDSYTYVQGTAGFQNFSFIGSYLPGEFRFTPEQLLANKIVQNFTGTAEGGPNWVEYLTGCGLRPGETSPLECDVQLWDFAFAGADVSAEYLRQHHDFTIPLVNQTQQYLTYADPVLGMTRVIDGKARALVAVWIGINDISDSSKFTNISFPLFYDTLIRAVFEQSVRLMYDAGYKNFLFLNLPPLERTVANLVAERPLPNKTMISWWNESLARHSRDFAARHHGATVMVYDANAFLNGVLDNPTRYGIRNTTSFCRDYADPDVLANPGAHGCLPLDDYFWYNSGHMSSQTHKVMTSDIARFLKEQSRQKKSQSTKMIAFDGYPRSCLGKS